MLIRRIDDSRWRALVRPAKKLKVGERIRFGEASESLACLLASLDAEVEAKGEAGEVVLEFRIVRRGARRGDRADRRNAAAALYRRAPTRRAGGSRRLPDHVRRRSRRGRGADGGAAFHARPARAHRGGGRRVCIGSRCMSARARSCPSRSRTRADHVMHSEWGRVDAATAQALNAARARGGRIVAIGTTSLRLLESAADATGDFRAVRGRDGDIHHAGLRLSRGRCPVHQLPPAALDVADAGQRILRAARRSEPPTPTPSPPAIASTATATRASSTARRAMRILVRRRR